MGKAKVLLKDVLGLARPISLNQCNEDFFLKHMRMDVHNNSFYLSFCNEHKQIH